jgi:hypothetical protein
MALALHGEAPARDINPSPHVGSFIRAEPGMEGRGTKSRVIG